MVSWWDSFTDFKVKHSLEADRKKMQYSLRPSWEPGPHSTSSSCKDIFVTGHPPHPAVSRITHTCMDYIICRVRRSWGKVKKNCMHLKQFDPEAQRSLNEKNYYLKKTRRDDTSKLPLHTLWSLKVHKDMLSNGSGNHLTKVMCKRDCTRIFPKALAMTCKDDKSLTHHRTLRQLCQIPQQPIMGRGWEPESSNEDATSELWWCAIKASIIISFMRLTRSRTQSSRRLHSVQRDRAQEVIDTSCGEKWKALKVASKWQSMHGCDLPMDVSMGLHAHLNVLLQTMGQKIHHSLGIGTNSTPINRIQDDPEDRDYLAD